MLFCVPNHRNDTGICAHTYIFIALRDTITISSTGNINTTVPTTVRMCISSPHVRLMENAVKYASSISRILACDANAGCIALASLAKSFPVQIITVPLYPTSSGTPTQFSTNSIRAILQGETTFAVFMPNVSEALFTQLPSNGEYVEIPFLLPWSGTRFLISPIYTLVSQTGQIQLAILTAHTSVRRFTDSATLPTPPPSPRSHTPTCASKASDQDGRPPLQGPGVIIHRGSQEPDDSSRPSAIVARGLPRRGMLFVLFKSILGLLSTFLVLARVFWAPRSKTNEASALTVSSCPDEAPTGLADIDIDGDSSPALHPSDADDILIADDNVPQSASTLFMEVKEGAGMIALRPVGPLGSSCPIEIEMGGRSLETTARAINDSISLVEFQAGQNGWIKVSYVHGG